ncbi:MAG: FMN-binding protein [Flexilinea sp.]
MKGKGKRRMNGWIILLIVIVVLAAAGGIGWSFLSKEHREAKSLPLNAVNFSKLNDGTYVGTYEGGMYKWRVNEVRVTVSSGKVIQIEPLKGVEDQGNGSTKMLYDRVLENQSLQVDTISGATLTSKAYLQAIENALIQAQRE